MTASTNNSQNQPKGKRTYRTAAQWAKIVDEYESSDMTQEAFCKQHGIASSGLYKWRNKRKEKRNQSPITDLEDSSFINMTPGLDKSSAGWDIELQLGAETVLRIRSS
ncbi:MAG: transposase [Phycisphaerae bacterium]|nr:transposase [candidate division KSB1 bacterium]NIV03019.1 transposase [Phycisphaerae bacterium]NIR73131.1 transposase [candidate division KSB1 bacterium]NIS28328.1 transposase [candidate division KSB1 bacterium]NIT75216.1 transposase [candidate division KSB1 bacterium]